MHAFSNVPNSSTNYAVLFVLDPLIRKYLFDLYEELVSLSLSINFFLVLLVLGKTEGHG